MGIFQNNAGGAWDNAKKSFEKGVVINGETFYKKSEPHKASVTGDTVGDPFKDTSGPSMNILIKLMSIVSLVIAPHISTASPGSDKDCCKGKTEMCASENPHMIGKCDISLCATMSKAECEKMCDSLGCDSTQKAHCMSMYDSNGKFIGQCPVDKMEACHGDMKCSGESKDDCCKGMTDKACAADPAACKNKAEGKACCKDKQH